MKKLLPNIRQQQLIAAGLEVVKSGGFAAVSRESIAARAGCSPSLVRYYLQNREKMCQMIAAAAERAGNRRIMKEAFGLGLLTRK